MKAVRYHQYGDADVLQYEDVERPAPAAGQVLLQVAGAAFNPADAGLRGGYLQQAYPPHFPATPGYDVSGTVVEVGEGVDGFSAGDAVIGFLPLGEGGAAAEFALAPAEVLTAAPSTIPLADAAAVPSATLTAWQALFEHADLQAGQRILINGAGGSVGGFAVRLAKAAGAAVIATASPRSSDKVRAGGADEVVDHTATSIHDAVTEPVDVVLNLAPGSPAQQSDLLGLVRPGGVFVTTVPPGPDAADEADLRAVTMFVRSDAGQLAGIVAKIDAGELVVDVSERVPLQDLRVVHERSDAGDLAGKVVLTPTN